MTPNIDTNTTVTPFEMNKNMDHDYSITHGNGLRWYFSIFVSTVVGIASRGGRAAGTI